MSIDSRIIEISGTAIPIPGDNIDTDQITPADAMKEPTFDNAASYLFRDARKKDANHPLNDPRYEGASVMFVGKNFGSGSSRETAPQAIKRYGIKALVGESFAAIFAGNCKALGIPAVTSSYDAITSLMEFTRENPNTIYTLNLGTKTLGYDGTFVPIDLPEPTRIALMQGSWNALNELKSNANQVREISGRLAYTSGFPYK